jgi:hypothetical protein
MTLVEASSMGSRYMSVNTACRETDEAQCAGAVGDIYVESGTTALYYWQDRDLNSSWWAHFQSDPTTSQYVYWSEWGFYPTIADNFRCETQSGVYQVPKLPLSNNFILETDSNTVGLLIRMALRSRNHQFLLAPRPLDPLARLRHQ